MSPSERKHTPSSKSLRITSNLPSTLATRSATNAKSMVHVRAIFLLPRRIGRVVCELVLAPPFGTTYSAHSLKSRMTCGCACVISIRSRLISFMRQYNKYRRRFRPFAGENGEIGSANAHGHGRCVCRLGRTATIEVGSVGLRLPFQLRHRAYKQSQDVHLFEPSGT